MASYDAIQKNWMFEFECGCLDVTSTFTSKTQVFWGSGVWPYIDKIKQIINIISLSFNSKNKNYTYMLNLQLTHLIIILLNHFYEIKKHRVLELEFFELECEFKNSNLKLEKICVPLYVYMSQ